MQSQAGKSEAHLFRSPLWYRSDGDESVLLAVADTNAVNLPFMPVCRLGRLGLPVVSVNQAIDIVRRSHPLIVSIGLIGLPGRVEQACQSR